MIKQLPPGKHQAADHEPLLSENTLHPVYLPSRPGVSWRERLSRNLALSALLLLAVASFHNARLPGGDTVLTAVQQIVEQNWDDSLGKISFVGHFFPESAAVFFENQQDAALLAPCFGPVSHAWSDQEPYLGYIPAANENIYAAAAGTVEAIQQKENNEVILRIRQRDGLEALYYLTGEVFALEGDFVTTDTCLGRALEQSPVYLEIRKDGLPIEPAEQPAVRNGGAL